ncbi:hypothetical protein B0H13DRAFT_2653069 [Mycena leptocephala]|nr:hypothetical protein B0H13DRAFT_2653069 [Mycena leptocephala]
MKLLEHLLTGLSAFATKEQATRVCSGRSGRVGRRRWTGSCIVCASRRRVLVPIASVLPTLTRTSAPDFTTASAAHRHAAQLQDRLQSYLALRPDARLLRAYYGY